MEKFIFNLIKKRCEKKGFIILEKSRYEEIKKRENNNILPARVIDEWFNGINNEN